MNVKHMISKPGSTLANGATLIEEKITHVERDACENTRIESTVIAIHPGVQPFVTWTRWRTFAGSTPDPDAKVLVEDCAWGHYFSSVETALHDFKRRYSEKSVPVAA